MSTFTWRDTLTVSVGECSRTQAIECTRAFDALTKVVQDFDELMAETNVLGVVFAPNVVRVGGEIFSAGEREIAVNDEMPFKLILPLTHDNFVKLPVTLTRLWIDAMVRSNGWLIDDLKNWLSLISASNSEPKSGSAPSNEPTAEPQTTTIPGA